MKSTPYLGSVERTGVKVSLKGNGIVRPLAGGLRVHGPVQPDDVVPGLGELLQAEVAALGENSLKKKSLRINWLSGKWFGFVSPWERVRCPAP